MGKSYLAVFGHTVVDYIMSVKDFPEPNTTVQVENLARHYGGTGANIARAAARLGVPTALASFIGAGFPEDYRQALAGEGVDMEHLKVVKGFETPRCWIVSNSKHDQIAIIDQGPMQKTESFDVPEELIAASDIIHISTGKPEYYENVLAAARRKGKLVGFDPAQELRYVYSAETFAAFLERADYFFCNKGEMKIALDYLGEESKDALLDHAKNVIITRGAEGVEVLNRDGSVHVPAFKANAVDTTGAGDAFRAGFYAGLFNGMDLKGAASAGAAVASFAVEKEGPQSNLPDWSQAQQRIAAGGL
jgi:ribokinase